MKILTMSILIALAATVSAQTYTTTQQKKAAQKKKLLNPPPVSWREPQGVLQRGARGGNILQMLNPKAPAKYGTSADSVILDESGKWRGIKFLEFFF
jgi:hypothetical protein